MCVEVYVEEPKGQVSKSLTVQTLQSCRLALTNSSIDQWNGKSLGLPYFVWYSTIYICHLSKGKGTIF